MNALGRYHGRGVRLFASTTEGVDRSTIRAGHRPWDRAAPPSGPGHDLGGDGERLRGCGPVRSDLGGPVRSGRPSALRNQTPGTLAHWQAVAVGAAASLDPAAFRSRPVADTIGPGAMSTAWSSRTQPRSPPLRMRCAAVVMVSISGGWAARRTATDEPTDRRWRQPRQPTFVGSPGSPGDVEEARPCPRT